MPRKPPRGRRTRRALLVLAVLLVSVRAGAGDVETPPGCVPFEDGYVVVLKPDASKHAGTVHLAAEAVASRYRAAVGHVYERSFPGFSARLTDADAAELAADPQVQHVERDCLYTPGDSQLNPPWGLDRIDQRERARDNLYSYDTSGAGVHVYVIDSGIRASHREFTGRVGNGVSFVAGGTADCRGHGTHVSGTVGGTTFGVAKQAVLHPVRVFGCSGPSPTSTIIAAVEWVTANRQLPAVANMSLGGPPSTSLDAAVRTSIASGVTYVVSAGNDSGASACQKSPARVAEAVTVAASDVHDRRAGFSNIGPCVDLFAPGVDVMSAWYTSDTAQASNSGTSMAAPHVAGAAARFLQTSPSATPAVVQQALVQNATVGRLQNVGAGSPNRLLYTAFMDTQFVASFVAQEGAPRTTFVSTHADPPGFEFFYDPGLGNFEQRPGGACHAGQDNPTYLKVRFVLPPGRQAQACSFRGSWDSQWSTCNAAHLNAVNSGAWVTLNTDWLAIDPATCQPEQPARVILPYNRPGWFHVNLTIQGRNVARRINFIKVLDLFPDPPPGP